MKYYAVENKGFMDNLSMDAKQKGHVYMQNTICLECFYLQRVLGRRYHSNETPVLNRK